MSLNKTSPEQEVKKVAGATARLVQNVVSNWGRLASDAIGDASSVARKSEGLWASVARVGVQTSTGVVSRMAKAVADAAEEEQRRVG